MALFSLKGVSFKNILCYPDIEIEQGQITFVCGKSGVGKSSLLKLMNGVYSAKSGTVCFQDEDINHFDIVLFRQKVILCGQTVFLFDDDIRANYHHFYAYRGLQPPDDETISSLLEVCAVNFPLDTHCINLSGGERQRIFISIALSFTPQVLLLDEPTSALDEETSARLLNNITNYCRAQEISLTVVSHNKDLAARFSEHTIWLGD